MAIMELSVNPIGTGTASVARYVARAVEVVQNEPRVRFTVTPMGTVVEGDLDDLLSLIPRMHEAVFGAGVNRVVTVIKIDDRRDIPGTMTGKLESLRRELKNPLP